MTMTKKLALTFRVFKKDQLLFEETLRQSAIKIGTVPSAHLKLNDENVSRLHAVIEVHDPSSDVQIIDLGSLRGTYVNGEKVTKAKLQTGDLIVVGDTRIEVRIDHEAITERRDETRIERAIGLIVSTAKQVAPGEPRKAIELMLIAALAYCQDDLRMPKKEACDTIDMFLTALFEQLGE